MDRSIKKPINEPSLYILLALLKEPLSGYDLARNILAMTNGRLEIKTGIMYPTLSALSNLEYIELLDIDNPERNKKIYKITQSGRKAVESELKRIEMMMAEIKTAIEGGTIDEEYKY